MTVFYDHQAFSLQDFGGISRIFTELIKASGTNNFEAHLSLCYTKNRHLEEAGLRPISILNKIGFFQRRKLIYEINNAYNIYDIKKQNFDVYHPTYYGPELIKYAHKKPVIVTFHDLIHEKFLGKFSEMADQKLLNQKKKIAHLATHIIAVSENTKKDLIDIYEIEPSRISVIYLGSSLKSPGFVNKTNEKSYLLFVGNRGVYKNFIPMVKAIAPLLNKYDVNLVAAGGKGFDESEKKVFNSLNVSKFVIHKSVMDSTLPSIYANATAFLFPSLYEGFGIPVLEAFSCDCPCVISNTSSLTEVGGDAVLYLDPYDSNSIYSAVEKILTSKETRLELIAKGQTRVGNFSWGKHVKETYDLYDKVCS